MKLEGYPRRIDSVAKPKRVIGLCSRCPEGAKKLKWPGRSYCLECDREYSRERNGSARRPGKNEMTPRRLQVLRLRCEGVCDKKIGVQLGLRTGSVKAIGSWLRQQAKAKTQAQLGVWAVRNGYVPLEAPVPAASNTAAARLSPAPTA